MSQTPSKRATFGTRFGFYMAAVGAALGLGNVWRFPYLTGENGGGAFVLLYIFCVAAIGLPAMVCELMLGKLSRRNVVGALQFAAWTKDGKWSWWGYLSLAANVLVLSYYLIVSGWVLHFIVQGALGRFSYHLGMPVESMPSQIIDQLLSKGYLQIALASVHLIITTSIVSRGVQNGIEKAARIYVPTLILVLLFLVVNSMMLPGAPEALRFLFYPDFSKLTVTSIIEALGHALFTLSLGFGAMVAYGSYLKKEIHTPTEAFWIATIDIALSLCVGLVIFPIVFTAKGDVGVGPALLFKTLPLFFGQVSFGYWLGLAFFVCLYFAALASSVTLFEGLVAYLMDERKMPRKKASYLVSAVAFALGIVTAVSRSLFKTLRLGDRGLLEITDQVIISWMLPVAVLGTLIFVAYFVPENEKKEEFIDQRSLVSSRLYPTWRFGIRYAAPALIVILFLVQLVISVLSVLKN